MNGKGATILRYPRFAPSAWKGEPRRFQQSANFKRRVIMIRRSLVVIILILCCLALIVVGCPKKTVMKEEPSVTVLSDQAAAAAAAAEKERATKIELERLSKEKEMKAREDAAKKLAEEAARKSAEEAARKSAEEAAKRRLAEEAAKKAAAEKEFEKSLVAKRDPGIEGQVLESKLLRDVLFDFDRYDIRPEDTSILKENAALLMKYPKVKIQIEGHCDERGTIEYNLALGQRRANSCRNYLMSLGIAGDRISTISYGKEKPLDPGHNEEAWAKNRRGHTVILSR
jgi:peptidoglycan-associated lipoprotein